MSQASYPTIQDLASFLDAAGFALSTSVALSGSGAVQTLGSVQGLKVGDQLFFRTANIIQTILAVSPSPANQVTLSSAIASTLGEVVIDLPASLNLAAGIAAGIARFENAVGRVMLAPVTPVARTFDPPVNNLGMLDLKADLAALVSVTYQGAAQVTGTDYRALPQDAPAESLPYNRLEFGKKWYSPISPGQWGQLVVTGRWGYGVTIPDDAWEAMLEGAALVLLPQIITAIVGGLVEWKEADVTESYGPEPFAYLRKQWETLFGDAAIRYRRVTVGL